MWFYFALCVALWNSISPVLTKKVTKTVDPISYIFIANLFYIPLVFIVIFAFGGVPKISMGGYSYMIIAGILDTIGFLASIHAIQKYPISLLSPISAFNPVFTTVFAMIGLSENPTLLKFLGICIVVIGSYILQIRDRKQGLFRPFITLFSHKGVQLVLLANFIWGITPIFQKKAVLATTPHTPLFVSGIGFLVMTLILIPMMRNNIATIPTHLKKPSVVFLFISMACGGMLAYQAAFTAFTLTNVGYATAIFKLSAMFTVIWGAMFFKEKEITQRLIAALVMLLGTILLVI